MTTPDQLRATLAALDCDPYDNGRVVSLLCEAAQIAAARFHDKLDCGSTLDPDLRWRWGKVASLLGDIGEWASPALGAPDEPGELHVNTLEVVFAAHQRKWEEYERRNPE